MNETNKTPTSKTLAELARDMEVVKIPTVDTLKFLDLDVPIVESVREYNGESSACYTVTVGGTEYRVPKSVIVHIKDLIEKAPSLSRVVVKKSGSGMDSRYFVIPLF